jgi:hypothetical protein
MEVLIGQEWNQEGRQPPQKEPQKELFNGQCTGIYPKHRPLSLPGHKHMQNRPFYPFSGVLGVSVLFTRFLNQSPPK